MGRLILMLVMKAFLLFTLVLHVRSIPTPDMKIIIHLHEGPEGPGPEVVAAPGEGAGGGDLDTPDSCRTRLQRPEAECYKEGKVCYGLHWGSCICDNGLCSRKNLRPASVV